MKGFLMRFLMMLTACLYPVFAIAAEEPLKEMQRATEAQAILLNADQEPIGHVSFMETPTGLLLRLSAKGLPPGWHGAHLHAVGNCSDAAFKKAGGHINPEGKEHGLKNPKGPDSADMPNLYASRAGELKAEVFTTRLSLSGQRGLPALLDKDGSALLIHEGEDDHISQPIGGAGKRIACGVVKQITAP